MGAKRRDAIGGIFAVVWLMRLLCWGGAGGGGALPSTRARCRCALDVALHLYPRARCQKKLVAHSRVGKVYVQPEFG